MAIRNEVKAGLLVLVGITLFVASIFVMGRERQLFQKQYSYFAEFKDVKGLQEGAPVRLGGIGIGRVVNVSFTSDVQHLRVRVTLDVNQDQHFRIRTDAKAVIETQGLLGDRFINLLGGSAGEPLGEGGVISSVEPSDLGAMADEVKKIVERSQVALDHFDQMIVSLNTGGISELTTVAAGLRQTIDSLNNGEGFLHELIYSKDLSGSIVSAFKDISASTHAVRSGGGPLSRLIFDKSAGTALEKGLTSLEKATSSVASLLGEIKTSESFVHSLFYGKASDQSSTSFTDILTNVDSITRSLANGKGTLGALLMDSKVYDNLTEITDEAKRSALLRYAIKSSLKQD